MTNAQPVATADRIHAIDIIRGFALFGVLWMNLFEHVGLVMPYNALDHLPSASVDRWVGAASQWLMQGKAQALFSLLFGFGFANIMSRLDARGASPAIFLRRIAVLLVFGLIDMFLLWIGDILTAYALMGFVLYFTRNWPTRLLVLAGLPIAVLGMPLLQVAIFLIWDGNSWWMPLWDEGLAIRGELFTGNDYPAYVAELWRAAWVEWWTTPAVLPYLAQIFGRFLLGSWVFRKGWLGNVAAHRRLFARTALVAVPVGLLLAGFDTAVARFDILPGWTGQTVNQLATLVLAVGYGSGIVLLHLSGRFAVLFAGLQAVGRMALTNYLTQSLFYVFAIYGFGLGLMAWLGATLSLALAVAFFSVQIVFSRWWLARYRFGPLEWLWRWLTYGERPGIRLQPAAA
jgi:uncharacterized protein